MNSYERVMCCLNHEPADRLPLDGLFHPETWRKLMTHFCTEDREVIHRTLGIDLRSVGMGNSDAFRARASRTHRGWRIVHSDGSLEDEWGVHVKFEETQRYYHFVHQPLADESALPSYRFPDLDAPGRFQAGQPPAKKEYAYIAHNSNLFKACWHVRGMDQWLMDLAANVDFAEALLDRMLQWQLDLVRRQAAFGVDIIGAVGDISMQTGMMIRPETWRRLFKPREAALVQEARRHGVQHSYFHTDGDPTDVLDDLVEIGFDIFDPVQPECVDPAAIKRRYGDRLTLHGTVSSQRTLPFGTVADVQDEVLERIRTCGYNGGLIVSPSNTVQPDVPLQNLFALYDTVRSVGAAAFRTQDHL